MGRRAKLFDIKEEFMKHVDKKSAADKGCWLWNLKLFRFRIELFPECFVFNPRRYCAYIHGYNIQVGRHVTHGCANENCVNPEHTILKHNRKPISQHTPFYLSFDDLKIGSGAARITYGRTMEEMRVAREATLELIKSIKLEPAIYKIEHIMNKYDVGSAFATQARKLNVDAFRQMRATDPSDDGYDPIDELKEQLLPDAHLFMKE